MQEQSLGRERRVSWTDQHKLDKLLISAALSSAALTGLVSATDQKTVRAYRGAWQGATLCSTISERKRTSVSARGGTAHQQRRASSSICNCPPW
eukprot:CAMPEP_0181213014 /NCGR_PEP_ID=MMETSP1096-20121128/24672_1 /TAXON_ID=156174 ORGANISM="Chrysochromulina ericina, Strain CCMP281" /NCGR_SAMPLE_ID=MMETSP1096 /ASSEMBLY_ACC=CAM_ASM_000453 /LENGTH=93 /DNA_ID=CAMNT_0023304611 /DNA_START=415 /DNA_END=693 /DNA_ORIENTATION=+